MTAGWLLLRGLTRESRHWGPFPDALASRLSSSVTCLDLPGFGTESHRSSPASVDEICEDLRPRWLAGGDSRPRSLISISLGGMVALHWMMKYPGDFERVVVINSSVPGMAGVTERLRPQNWFGILRAALEPRSQVRERIVYSMVSNSDSERRTSWAERSARWMDATPASRISFVRQLWAAARFTPPVPSEHAPLLVLASKADRFVSYRCSERLAHAYHGELKLHETAGHDLPMDDPDWIISEISSFLSRGDSLGPPRSL